MKKRRIAVLLAAILVFGAILCATMAWSTSQISQSLLKTIGGQATGYASMAAARIELTDERVAQLKGLTSSELQAAPENMALQELFSSDYFQGRVDYAYIMIHLDDSEVAYYVTPQNADVYDAPVGTAFDVLWLLDVNVADAVSALASDDDPLSRYGYWNEQDDEIFNDAPTYVVNDDEWGRHICGYAPVYTVEGTFVGVMGVDLSVVDYNADVARATFVLSLLIVIIVLGLCGLFALYLAQARKRQLERKADEERYRILMSTNTQTFDYDIAQDRLTFAAVAKNERLVESTVESYLETLDQKTRIEPDCLDDYRKVVQTSCTTPGSYNHTFKADFGKGSRWYEAHFVSVVDERGRAYRVVGRIDDIQREKSIEESARIDPLTGLLNRGAAEADIMRALRNPAMCSAFLLLDIDNFKGVNDTHGHAAGDEAIKHVARALMVSFRHSDVVYRLGGDEFAVFLQAPTRDTLDELLELKAVSIQGAVRAPDPALPTSLVLTVSMGATVSEDGASLDELYHRADEALYDAKRNGKGRHTIR